MDHVGPIARCVHDLAILLKVIAGQESAGPPAQESHVETNLDRGKRGALRLGLLGGLFQELADVSVRTNLEWATERLQSCGASVVQVAPPPSFSEVLKRHRIVMAVEAAAFHEARLRQHPDDYGPQLTTLLQEGLACPAPEYVRTLAHRRRLVEEFSACFEGVDAVLVPATTSPAPSPETTGDPAFNSPWSYTGFPSVSIPSGWFPEGLPTGNPARGPATIRVRSLGDCRLVRELARIRFPGASVLRVRGPVSLTLAWHTSPR